MIWLVASDGSAFKVCSNHDFCLIQELFECILQDDQDIRVPLQCSPECAKTCADERPDPSAMDNDAFREFVLVANYLNSQTLISIAQKDFQRRLCECQTPDDLKSLAGDVSSWDSEDDLLNAIADLPSFLDVDKNALAELFTDH